MSICENVRWMIRRDIPEVLSIDAASFPKLWDEERYMEMLRARNVIGMVSERKEIVTGLLVYELFKERLVIRRLAVHPDYRNQGIGTGIITKLIGKLSSHRRFALDIKVNEYNLQAQLFLKHRGFFAVKSLGNSYIMQHNVGKAPISTESIENRISKYTEFEESY